MEGINTAVTNLFQIVNACLDAITSNEWLAIPFVAGLVGVGVGILRKLKR
jgi:hypothetical protein